jgi:prepilin-type N-terminal cleavage/methylation domain-containing protein
MRHQHSGTTLVELIVVLAIIGVIAGVTTVALRRAPAIPDAFPWAATVAAARRQAIDSGRPITVTFTIAHAAHAMTALPDGSVVADSALRLDRLSGTPPTHPQTDR